jgi:DNA-binding phage protein
VLRRVVVTTGFRVVVVAVFAAGLAVVLADVFFAVDDFCVCPASADEAGRAMASEAAKTQIRRAVLRDQFGSKDNPLRDSLLEVVSAL